MWPVTVKRPGVQGQFSPWVTSSVVWAVLGPKGKVGAMSCPSAQPLSFSWVLLEKNPDLISSSSSFREGEAWTPVCLPKFNAAGFFHAHISYLEPDTDLCLLLVSTDREDFFAVSDCRRRFQERLRKRGAHLALREALRTPYYSVAQVGVPDLRHFLYKSKSSGLFTR